LESLTFSVLINDVVIIEPIVRDDLILGVAGILECTKALSRETNSFKTMLSSLVTERTTEIIYPIPQSSGR